MVIMFTVSFSQYAYFSLINYFLAQFYHKDGIVELFQTLMTVLLTRVIMAHVLMVWTPSHVPVMPAT
jgi:hypothetical protein